MTINIQDLLRELVSYTDIRTSDISFEAKFTLGALRKEFKRLETGNEPDKQAKMIALFMGATIFAVIFDDVKYRCNIYPKELAKEIFKIDMYNSIPDLIQLGKEALSRLPQSFNVEHLKLFYPKFRQNPEKIDQLVKFCIDHKENLEQATMETEDSESADSEASNKIKNSSPQPKKSEPQQPTCSNSSMSESADSTEDSESANSEVSEKIKNLSFQPKKPEPQQPTCSNTSMQVIGGFIAVLGATAVAIAFVSLNASTFGLVGLIVAGLGVAATLSGLGLFASATNKKCQAPSDDALDKDGFDYSSFSM